MRRRTILIEQPPTMWIEQGSLIYCDFGVQDGSVIAFRPHIWLATSAIGQDITKKWLNSGADVLQHPASGEYSAKLVDDG